MGLLRKIFTKNPLWRFNNKPYIEPTEEQKELYAIRRKEAQRDLAMMFGTIEAMCPGVMYRTEKMVRNAGMKLV